MSLCLILALLMAVFAEQVYAEKIEKQVKDGDPKDRADSEGLKSMTERLKTPIDLKLKYHSDIDGTDQPFRLYLPSAYDGKKRLPLFIAMHGTGGDQDKYFDHKEYGNGIYKREAEKRGIIVVCPHGRGTTEYRGIGENDVLNVLEYVKNNFLVDENRIILSGQSMGGTGTTYLCCRYPDLFTAGVPLASCYGHMTLIPNLKHVPMFYVQGEKDWRIYAKEGPIPISKRMEELDYDVTFWIVPDMTHNTMLVSTERVLDWALEQRLVRHPKDVTFRAYLPIHGKAYWLEIQEMDQIGPPATIDASIRDGNVMDVQIRNTKRFALRPEPELLSLYAPIYVVVNGEEVFEGTCTVDQEIRLTLDKNVWNAEIVPRKVRSLTAYRTHKMGKVISAPDQKGNAETTMGNWMADAMRDASGADVAIYNRRHYRGVPLVDGQDVYIVDLLNWIRPMNRCLSVFEINGEGLMEIIEDNIRDQKKELEFLVQVSGFYYAFDRNRPKGQRIVETDIDPDRTYRVVCENCVVSRETLHLAERFEKIDYRDLEITNISAAWRYIDRCGGLIKAKRESRVRDLTEM